MIRVMIVDDSVVVRRLLAMILKREPDIEVAFEARNGREALDHFDKIKPDLVTLDVEMPELDGLATLKELRKKDARVPVIMFSTLTSRGANTTIEALSLGASDYLTKPESASGLHAALDDLGRELVPRVREFHKTASRRREMARMLERPSAVKTGEDMLPGKTFTRPESGKPGPRIAPPPGKPAVTRPFGFARPKGGSKVDLLVIGVSTGGPNALARLLPAIPADFPVPILVVQHMPPLFTRMLAERLDQQCKLHVQEARDGARVLPGEIWIARGDWHMEVRRDAKGFYLKEHQGPQVNSCRPAVDPLFNSAVSLCGEHLLGVVLTGMGRDGADGALKIRDAGGSVFAQSESTCVVWGMPGAVVQNGSADEVLDLDEMAPSIIRRVMHGRLLRQEALHGPRAN